MTKITVEEGLVKYRPFIMNRLKKTMKRDYSLDYDEMYQDVCVAALAKRKDWKAYNSRFTTFVKWICLTVTSSYTYHRRMDEIRLGGESYLEHKTAPNDTYTYVNDIISRLPHPHIVYDTMAGLRLKDMEEKYKVHNRQIGFLKAENKAAYQVLMSR